MALVKLHRNQGALAPDNRAGVTGWNLAMSNMGTLVYTHDTKGAIARIFAGLAGQQFSIYDQAIGEQNIARKFLIALGTYEGKTEQFETLNYLHQRQAVLGNFGKTGNKTVDKVWGPISAAANYPETIARFGIALTHRKASIPKKYFVALMNASKHGQTGQIMHNQLDVTIVKTNGPATLAAIVQQNMAMFQAKV